MAEQVTAQVLKERLISIEDASKNIGQFLKRRFVSEQLSAENHSRLYSLLAALEEESKEETRKEKRSSSDTELDDREPDRKKRRRRCIT